MYTRRLVNDNTFKNFKHLFQCKPSISLLASLGFLGGFNYQRQFFGFFDGVTFNHELQRWFFRVGITNQELGSQAHWPPSRGITRLHVTLDYSGEDRI
jgi:hypothetical protein